MTTEMKHLIFKNIFRDEGKLQALTAMHLALKNTVYEQIWQVEDRGFFCCCVFLYIYKQNHKFA